MAISKLIETLQQVFSADQIATASTEQFEKLNQSYLSLLQSDLEPVAIILPRTKDEVATFVRTIQPFVVNEGVQFAIRGAGQQPSPGCSNMDSNGVTLDLRLITGIQIKDGVVSRDAGERWGPVYEKLAEQNFEITGSRSALGGIGGLALADMLVPFLLQIIFCSEYTDLPWTAHQADCRSFPQTRASFATILSTTRSYCQMAI